jgi:hypothetical protein
MLLIGKYSGTPNTSSARLFDDLTIFESFIENISESLNFEYKHFLTQLSRKQNKLIVNLVRFSGLGCVTLSRIAFATTLKSTLHK